MFLEGLAASKSYSEERVVLSETLCFSIKLHGVTSQKNDYGMIFRIRKFVLRSNVNLRHD
jgi:hypothetical protein